MKAVFASNNAHKLVEVRALFKDVFEEVYSLKDLGINVDIEETGTTFTENALIKAKTICKMVNMPTLADDSGLEVEALNNEPGVYSARYAGEPCNDENNNTLLLNKLHELEKTQPANRKARFVSAFVIYYPNDTHKEALGYVNGHILDEYRGYNGFGYDPLFFCDELNKTFAQADMSEKNQVSHRARAIAALLKQL